jgi:organic hydroperoxide reductase OsmC/OhrA
MAHVFRAHVAWSGSLEGPTVDPATFSRDLELTCEGQTIPLSAAPAFRGNPGRVNPEQLFVASVAACQALTYLFLAARHGVAVLEYEDDADGELSMVNGRLQMTRVTLRPRITVAADADGQHARALVERAHDGCFIANSISAVVHLTPTIDYAPMAQPVG